MGHGFWEDGLQLGDECRSDGIVVDRDGDWFDRWVPNEGSVCDVADSQRFQVGSSKGLVDFCCNS